MEHSYKLFSLVGWFSAPRDMWSHLSHIERTDDPTCELKGLAQLICVWQRVAAIPPDLVQMERYKLQWV